MSEYYYLLSGLSEVSIGEQKKTINIHDISVHILEQLEDKDREIFRYLLYQNDNKNIAYKYAAYLNLYSPYKDYVYPSVYSQDVVEHPETVSSSFPPYLQKFGEYSKTIEYTSIRQIENTLLNMYFDEALAIKNNFVSNYFSFVRDLRNIIAAINMRFLNTTQESIRQEFVGSYELVDALSKSSSLDFGVSKEYPYITELLDAFENKDPYAFEKAEMDIVFEYLNRETSSMFFQFENVFAYYIKCLYIERIMSKDAEKGKEVLRILISEMKKDIENLN